MSTLGNVVWLIFGGLLTALGYIIGGLALCITIVGIPFGLQSMKIGVATLAPFGKEVVETSEANSALRIIFNLVWLVLFGWEIALAHLLSALILTITIVGIPLCQTAHQTDPSLTLPVRTKSDVIRARFKRVAASIRPLSPQSHPRVCCPARLSAVVVNLVPSRLRFLPGLGKLKQLWYKRSRMSVFQTWRSSHSLLAGAPFLPTTMLHASTHHCGRRSVSLLFCCSHFERRNRIFPIDQPHKESEGALATECQNEESAARQKASRNRRAEAPKVDGPAGEREVSAPLNDSARRGAGMCIGSDVNRKC